MSSAAASSSNASASTIRKSPSPSDASEEMNRSPIVEEDDAEDEEIDLSAEIEEEKKLAKQNSAALNARAGISAADWKAMSASDRLDALLKQTTLFSQFVSGSANKPKTEESGRGRRKAHSEKEEDENLVKEAETDLAQDDQITRLTVQPSSVKAEMRSYQLEALNWLIKLYDGGINGILADEMGLGKTLESLSMLAYLKQFRGIDGPHLVIVPKSTSSNWMREIARFTPQLTAFKFHGTEEQRMEQKKQLGKTSICVTTYEIAIREKAALRKIDWQYLYIDEAHRIKNEKSLLASIVRTFNSKRRLLITGTPLQNNLHELWALLNFLLPQVFDSADDFAQWFNLEGDDRAAVVQRLHRILRPFILRRLKSEVEKSLPPKVETNLYIGLSALQRTWYTKILSREFHVISDIRGRKTALLNIVMQLRKVCNHPYLFDGAEPGPPYLEGEHLIENCGKMILLDKLLKRLKETGRRVLIFSQMTRMLDILEDYSRYRGFEYCRIDGQTEQVVRDEQMDTFNAPGSSKFLFLLSTRAGGLGINLQTADTVILYDSDWNPQMDLQAQDRAHRIGQKNQVNVFRFITERTLEEKIVQRANEKLFLDAVVIQQGRLGEKSKVLSANELQEMVRFGASHIFQSKDATITDADIDAILAKGKERTEEEAAKMKKTVNFNNMNFTSDGFSVNEFEGKDYAALRAQQRAAAGFDFIELSKRERKGGTYDINKYYREALRVSEPKPGKKEWKPTARHDFQFFQSERLMELERREHESKVKLKELIDAEKIREKEEKKMAYERAKEERKRKRRAARDEALKATAAGDATTKPSTDSGASSSPSAPAESAASGKREAEDAEMTDAKAPAGPAGEASGDKPAKNGKEEDDSDSEKDEEMPPADDAEEGDDKDQSAEAVAKREAREAKFAELRVQAGCLTEDEIKEKEELLQEGFGSWNKRHFQLYLRACEKHGRGEIDKIKHDVEGKTPEEVEAYHVVFWKRGKELSDWSKYVSQIEKGEERLEKLEQLGTVLKQKYDSKRDPFFALDVPYPLKTKQKTFTEEEDRFLICQMHLLGYGQWDEIRKAIRDSWMFRFDWFLKSLKSPEIARRCEYLMKLLQAEYDAKMEEEKAKRAAEAKKKKAQTKKQQTKKTPTKGKQTKSPKGKSPAGKKAKATPKGKQKKGAANANRKRKSSDDDEEEEEDEEAGSESGSAVSGSDEETSSDKEDGSDAESEEEEEAKPQKKKQKTAKGAKGKGTPAKKKGKVTPAKKGKKAASEDSDEESDDASDDEEEDEKSQPARKKKKTAQKPEPESDSDDDDMVLADLGKDDAGSSKKEKESDKDKEKDTADSAASPPPSARKIPKKPEEKKKTPSKDGAKPLAKTASSGGDSKAADAKPVGGDDVKKEKEEAKPAHVPKIPKKRGR